MPPPLVSGYTASDYATTTNVVWDVHYYGWLTNYSTNQATNTTTLLGIAEQAQTITGANGVIPVLVGEYGNSTTGGSLDANGNQVIAAVQASGLGGSAWAGGSIPMVTAGTILTAPCPAMADGLRPTSRQRRP